MRDPLVSAPITVMEDTLVAGPTPAALFERCRSSAAAGSAPSCPFRLTFAPAAPNSLVYKENQDLFAAVNVPFAVPIRVRIAELFASRDPLTPEQVPLLIAYTGQSPAQETLLDTSGDANWGAWDQNEYVFSCLRFREQPPGLVRIRFGLWDWAKNTQPVPYGAIAELRTGFVTVTSSVTSAFGIRFALQDSLVQYPTQPLSAVVDVALPQVVIELVDSAGAFDERSDIPITAAPSTGLLYVDGATERFSKGRAVFTMLRFAALGDSPVITFTVDSTPLTAAAGKTLKTGRITLTPSPIPAFELAFSPILDVNNNVTQEWQTIDQFATIEAVNAGKLSVSIILRDSAHQISPAFGAEIEMTSLQAKVIAKPTLLDPLAPCGCVNFSVSNNIIELLPTFTGTEIFIVFRYKRNSGNQILTGKTLTLGPIVISRSGSGGGGARTCTAAGQTLPVVAEFRIPLGSFDQQRELQRASIAYLMGVETDRVTFDTSSNVTRPRPTSGIDVLTLTKWVGTKVNVLFEKPTATSTNRKSPAQLAAEFVNLRPGCETAGLLLELVYYEKDDKSCKSDAFRAKAAESNECVARGGDSCDCFADIESWGLVCADESADAPTRRLLLDVCGVLARCRDDGIQNVCASLLAVSPPSLVWVWILLGALGGVGIIVAVLWWRGFRPWKTASTLHRTVDAQYE